MKPPTVRARCRGCHAWINVSPFAPTFPAGPFYCAPCAPRTRREGAPGEPDDDGGGVTAGDDTSTDAIVIDVSGRFGK
jgi:hypothetical protein